MPNPEIFGSNALNPQELAEIREPILLPTPKERWAVAEAHAASYPKGSFIAPNGEKHFFRGGRQLVINEEQVMDTCESPWARATVNAAMDTPAIQRLSATYPLKVLERGSGLNITGNRVIERLIGRGAGGEYHVIELNKKVAGWTREWRDKQLAYLDERSREQGIPQKIKIFVHEGEASEVSKELILNKGLKFNIIISDTFPLTPKETGLNDILDIDILKQGLYRDEGVFAFFAYFPGSEEKSHIQGPLTYEQYSLVYPHFKKITTDEVDVQPSKDYKYLFRHDGNPVTALPVVVCYDKK